MKIAYLGPQQTFTHAIAKKLYPKANLIAIQPIRKVIMAVENKKIDTAIVPIENFYNGEVRQTLDTLTECKQTKIIAESSEKINLCMGVLEGHGKIKKILSKDQALEQSSRYLAAKHPNITTIATPSTAKAAEIISKDQLFDAAAIASENALQQNNLKIVKKDICPNNKTRFIVLARKTTRSTKNDKTFLAIHPKIDKPGILHNTLAFLSAFNINLEYIQSRPDGKKGYYFYIELEGHATDENVKRALSSIKYFLDPRKEHPNTIKILGSYKNTNWKNKDEN